MPHFIPVLIVAVLMFAALLLAFGAVVTPSQPLTSPEEMRTIELGSNFSMGYMAAEQYVGSVYGTVSKGLLSGDDKKFSFSVSAPEDVSSGRIRLRINDTNGYGRLNILLNGNVLYNNFAWPGNHTIFFYNDELKTDNVIEFKAESSGWRFWAPTLYDLSAEISLSWRGALTRAFNFTLTDKDVSGATRGRLVVYVNKREGTGPLTVKLNGNTIYQNIKTSVLQDFTIDKFVAGANNIEFSAPVGTKYSIDSAEIIVYFT